MNDVTPVSSDRCQHCETRVSEPFEHQGQRFCVNCMDELISWLMEGGWIEEPDQFPGIVVERS